MDQTYSKPTKPYITLEDCHEALKEVGDLMILLIETSEEKEVRERNLQGQERIQQGNPYVTLVPKRPKTKWDEV